MSSLELDWSDIAFGDKKPLRNLKATFIMAPREISISRFTQLVKEYLPKSNIVLGLAKEDCIDGFEGQPQFATLRLASVEAIISKVNASASVNKLYTLRYFQRETDYLIGKLGFRRVVAVRGSWLYAFHNRSTYYTLVNNDIAFDMVSPFADEAEAKVYESRLWPEITKAANLPKLQQASYSPSDMLGIASRAAKLSYDYSFQTGASLGKPAGSKSPDYTLVAFAYNKVVPYQTYAMHHGAARELNFSPPNDLNHYDTVHAEVALLIGAQRQAIDLHGTVVFINLLPCPTCARMLAASDIAGLVYQQDHSDGYAIRMLEAAGKTVSRLV